MSSVSKTLEKELRELKQTEVNIQKKKDELISLLDNQLESIKRERVKYEKVYNSIIRR